MDIFDNDFDNDFDEELEEFEEDQLHEEESPQGGVVLQVIGYTGEVEDIIIGIENIREYINQNFKEDL